MDFYSNFWFIDTNHVFARNCIDTSTLASANRFSGWWIKTTQGPQIATLWAITMRYQRHDHFISRLIEIAKTTDCRHISVCYCSSLSDRSAHCLIQRALSWHCCLETSISRSIRRFLADLLVCIDTVDKEQTRCIRHQAKAKYLDNSYLASERLDGHTNPSMTASTCNVRPKLISVSLHLSIGTNLLITQPVEFTSI